MPEKNAKIDESSAAGVANISIRQNVQPGNKPERLEWLQDAGFGMFIHWGIDSQLGSVISHSVVGASKDYQDRFYTELLKTFKPKRFDPEEIAVLAKLAGMKYMVFTTKHHCGFCMWDTRTTDFNVMNTRYARDIVAEYVEAARKEGLAVGFYYSPEDWLFLRQNGLTIRRLGLDSEGRSVGFSDLLDDEIKAKYADYIRRQCAELMTNYGKIDVMFFDGGMAEPAKEVCWHLQPDILITRGAISTPEQTVPGVPLEGAWESCMTMGTQWQYKPTNETYKSGTRLIEILIEVRAKGGALLLNVGPKPDGTLPEQQEAILHEIALWHFVNGESVHNTRPWVVVNEGNIWFTRNKDESVLYAFITKLPDWQRGARKEFVLGSVDATAETEISVLGQSGELVEYAPSRDATSRWEQKEDGVHISVVRAQRLYNDSKWPNPVVVKLTNVKPALEPPKVVTVSSEKEEGGKVKLVGNLIDLGSVDSLEVGFEYRRYAGFVEELSSDEWQSTELTVIRRPGEFTFEIDGLPAGTYQFRAIARHPRIKISGDNQRFSV